LGGTFDPFHHAHMQMAFTVLKQTSIQEIIFVPTPQNPLKPNKPVASYEQRSEMVSLAISQFCHHTHKVSIVDGTTFMADTAVKLKDILEEDAELNLILGSDAVSLHKWERVDILLPLINLVYVVPRAGIPLDNMRELWIKKPEAASKIRILDSTDMRISSTLIRNGMKNITGPEKDLMPSRVYQYIVANGLYE
jgi:nicotinate-nucleotide adenylyltransferase